MTAFGAGFTIRVAEIELFGKGFPSLQLSARRRGSRAVFRVLILGEGYNVSVKLMGFDQTMDKASFPTETIHIRGKFSFFSQI